MNLTNIKFTQEESDRVEWCHSILDDEQIDELQDEAIEIAAVELLTPEAATELVRVLVEAIVRNNKEKK